MPDPGVDLVVEVLRSGGTAVLPTDTVYGLAALPAHAGKLFVAKGRKADVPIAVLCADSRQALALADPTEAALALAAAHWPGPLTLVCRRAAGVDWDLGGSGDTIGLRCPDHPLLRAVAAVVGPLATTSANRHGSPTPDNAAAAAKALVVTPDLVIDGGRLPGAASTVVDVSGSEPVLLRAGPIPL